jgi:hypothetical protein
VSTSPTYELCDALGPDSVVGMPLSCDKCWSGCWASRPWSRLRTIETLSPPDSGEPSPAAR